MADAPEYYAVVEEDAVIGLFMFEEDWVGYRDAGEWIPVTMDQEDPGDTAEDFVAVDEGYVDVYDDAEENDVVLINPEVLNA